MRISSKARYGLAAMIYIAQYGNKETSIPVLTISEKLDISKIYLEQVFALLKKSNLIISTKGSQGGYKLSLNASDISAYDILSAIETSLFEKTEKSLGIDGFPIEKAMNNLVWTTLNSSIISSLKKVTLKDLANEANNHNIENFMFYI